MEGRLDCTSGLASATRRRVPRPKEFPEQLAFLVKEGTREGIEAARGEVSQADFLRAAVDAAIRAGLRKKRS